MRRTVTGTLYRWDARRADTWVFLDVPPEASDDLAEAGEQVTRGFGSLRVEVTLGGTTWRTSVFPGSTGYVLPVKKAVRTAEGVDTGDEVTLTLRLVDV